MSSYSPISTTGKASVRRSSHVFKASLPSYRSPTTGEKRSWLFSLLPDSSSHARSRFRTLGTGILFIFITTGLWLIFIQPSVSTDVSKSVEKGTGWMLFKNIGWGHDSEIAPSSNAEVSGSDVAWPPGATEGASGTLEYVQEEAAFSETQDPSFESEEDIMEVKEPPLDAPTPVDEAEVAIPALRTSENDFSITTTDEVEALLASGALSAYKWHANLGTGAWNPDKTSEGRLLAIGDIHGQFESLNSLLTGLSFVPHLDTLLHLGNVVANAPLNESLSTVRLLRIVDAKGVRGDHDQGVIEWRKWMESYGTLVDTVVEEEAVVVPIKKTSIKKGKGKPKPKEKGIAKGKGKARPKAKPVEEVVVPDGRPTKLTRPKKGSKGKIQPNLNVVALRFKAKPKPKVKNPADLFGRTAKRLSKRGWFRWGSDESEDTKPASGESDTLENDFEPVSVESELYSADEETNEFGDETDAEDDADAGVDLTSNFLEDTTDTSTSDSPISTAENASPPFAPPAPYQQTIEDLAAQGALLGPGWSWLEGTKDDARQRGVVVPAGWEWGGEWFEIARHLPREDAAYLENLPLTIWIEGIQSYAVHAGMLPWVQSSASVASYPGADPMPSLLSSTSSRTFSPSSETDFLLSSPPSRSLLLVAQNSLPFTLLNMRGLRSRGNVWVPTSGTAGTPWHNVWNQEMEKCADRRGCSEVNVLYAHWAQEGLQIQKNSIGLDSACYAGRRLSSLVIDPSSNDSPLSSLAEPSTTAQTVTYRPLNRPQKPKRPAAKDAAGWNKKTRRGKLSRRWMWSGAEDSSDDNAEPTESVVSGDEEISGSDDAETYHEETEEDNDESRVEQVAEESDTDAENTEDETDDEEANQAEDAEELIESETPPVELVAEEDFPISSKGSFEERQVSFGKRVGWVVSVACDGSTTRSAEDQLW